MLDTLLSHTVDAWCSAASSQAYGECADGFAEDSNSRSTDGPPVDWDSPASAPLAALAGSALARRFCAWNGASGERYICSVFALENCPAFADAVVLAVRTGGSDARQIIAAADTGAAPEQLTEGPLLEFVRSRGANEWHVHLLCDSAAARRAILADLAPAL